MQMQSIFPGGPGSCPLTIVTSCMFLNGEKVKHHHCPNWVCPSKTGRTHSPKHLEHDENVGRRKPTVFFVNPQSCEIHSISLHVLTFALPILPAFN